MSNARAVVWAIIWVLAASGASAQTPAGANALPPGARLRLGQSGVSVGEPAIGGALSPDGRYLAAAGRDALTLFERDTGKRLARIDGNGQPIGMLVAFTRDAKVVAFGGLRTVTLARMPNGEVLHQLEVPDEELQRGTGLTLSADGNVVAIGMAQSRAKKKAKAFAWDVASGKLLGTFEVAQNTDCGAALSADGKLLVTWGRHVPRMIGEDQEPSQLVQIWDVATGKERRRIKVDRPGVQIHAAALSPDGKRLIVASGMATLHVFDAEKGMELRRFATRRGLVTCLQFSPDGTVFAVGTYDGGVQAWQEQSGKRLDLRPGPRGRVLSFAFPSGGPVLALSLVGQNVTWWDAVTGQAATSSPGHQLAVLDLAYSRDGRTLTSASLDGKVVRWEAATGKMLLQTVLADEETLRATGATGLRLQNLTLSPDGRFAAASSIYAGNLVRLWDLATGQIVCDFESVKANGQTGLAFTADGGRLAAAVMKTIHLWNTERGDEAGKVEFTPPENATGGARLTFSPDGKQVAVVAGYFDNDNGVPLARIALLDLARGKEVFAREAPSVNMLATMPAGSVPPAPAVVAFSIDSRLIALPGPGQTVTVVATDSGKERHRLETAGGFGAITALALSPDGRTVAIAHGGGRMMGPMGPTDGGPAVLELWELASGRRRARFTGQAAGVSCLAFAPDGRTLASGSADTTVILWDVTGRYDTPAAKWTAKDLDAAWATLAQPDGEASFHAQRGLIASPGEAVAFLSKHLRPAPPPDVDAKKIGAWVADLDSENFETRNGAFRSLEKLGTHAEPALRKARAGNTSLEMRRRIDDLLEKLAHGTLTPDELRAVRSVEVLERIATPEARALLHSLAKGAERAPLTQEARRALARLP